MEPRSRQAPPVKPLSVASTPRCSEAVAVAREIKDRLLAEHRASSAPASNYTLADGGARYVHETKAGQEIERQLRRCLKFLGPDKRMADVTATTSQSS